MYPPTLSNIVNKHKPNYFRMHLLSLHEHFIHVHVFLFDPREENKMPEFFKCVCFAFNCLASLDHALLHKADKSVKISSLFTERYLDVEPSYLETNLHFNFMHFCVLALLMLYLRKEHEAVANSVGQDAC